MKKLTLALLGATAGLAVSAGSAGAYTTYIYDSPLVNPTYSRAQTFNLLAPTGGPNNWVDVIGATGAPDGFQSGAFKVDWAFGADDKINQVTITYYTNYGLSGATFGGTYAGFADWFIDVGNTGTFDYAIDFKSEFNGQAPDGGGANLAQLVDLTSPGIGIQTSQDVFGSTAGVNYGGLTNICSGSTNADCLAGSRIPEVKVTGNSTYDLAVSNGGPALLTGPDGSETFQFAYSVVLSGIDFSGWGELRLFSGTGWCANDTVEGVAKVPVPAALPILAAALAGFGFAGWRQRRRGA